MVVSTKWFNSERYYFDGMRRRAGKAEAALDDAIKQIITMSDEMGKVEAERDEAREQRGRLRDVLTEVTACYVAFRNEMFLGRAQPQSASIKVARALLAEIDGEGEAKP